MRPIPKRIIFMEKKTSKTEGRDEFTPIAEEQIETANIRRIVVICLGTLGFEALNLLNPDFWSTSILWVGAIYLAAVSLAFLLAIVLRRPKALFATPELLNTAFWVLFTIGFFPFLVRDAASGGDSPLNCVLLCTVLICAPVLRVGNLRLVFGTSVAVNLAAAIYAGGRARTFQYAIELVGINVVGYLMARNLHGRYFDLLDDQRRLYDQQLRQRLEQHDMNSKLESDRAINAARSDFLSRMSHDLRTPLNAVIGLSDAALDPTLTREQVDAYLKDINVAARHQLSLVNDVLDITKLDNSKLAISAVPYDVADFISTMHSIIDESCRAKDISFDIVPDDGYPAAIVVDRLRYNQVFLNLLSNAVKFTPAGGRIVMRLGHQDRGGGTALLTTVVEDTGRGMDGDFVGHALEPFAQQEIADGEQGSGLGLAIVSRIVTLMGGQLAIDSTPGTGTAVTVELTAAVTAAVGPAKSGGTAVPPSLAGHRVLLCEDNRLNQKVAMHVLTKAGIDVTVAADGRQGVDMFSASAPWHFDAVLMDVRMPVMDGLEAAAAIRALDRPDAGTVPIIAMTANTYDEDAEKTRAAGMDDHLCKPVDPPVLYGTLSRLIAARSEARKEDKAPC